MENPFFGCRSPRRAAEQSIDDPDRPESLDEHVTVADTLDIDAN